MHKKFLFAVIAATIMGNAWADDGRVLTTQTYVDNADALKQDKIPAGTAGQIVLYNGTDANGQTKFTGRQITNEISSDTNSYAIPITGAVISYLQQQIPTYNELYDIMTSYKMEYPLGFDDVKDDYMSPRTLSLVMQQAELGGNAMEFLHDFEKKHTGLDIISVAHALYGLKHTWAATPEQTINSLDMTGIDTWGAEDYNHHLTLAEAGYKELNNIKKGFFEAYARWRIPTLETLSLALEDTIVHPKEIMSIMSYGNVGISDIRELYSMNIDTDQNLANLLDVKYGRLVPDLSTLIYSLNGLYTKLSSNIENSQPRVTGTPNALVTYNLNGELGGERIIATTIGTDTTATTIPTTGAVYAAVNTRQAKKVCIRWLDTPEHPEHNDENCLLWELPD